MDDIMSGRFSETMMKDWADDDVNLLTWRAQTADTPFEKAVSRETELSEQAYFDCGILMVAMVKAGVELAYDTMDSAGIVAESAYYESLHEVPLIANLIARKKLYEMNVVISDTAEYGCYLFSHSAVPMLQEFMASIDTDVIGKGLDTQETGVDNIRLIQVNEAIRSTSVEQVGKKLRTYMGAMRPIF
jgi:ketol-acid reductoisomerase